MVKNTSSFIKAKEEVTAKAKVGSLFSNYMVDENGNITLPDGEVLFWLNTEKQKPKKYEKPEPVIVAGVKLSGLNIYNIDIANPQELPIKHVEVDYSSHIIFTSVILKSSKYPDSKSKEILTYNGGCSFDDTWNEDLTVVLSLQSAIQINPRNYSDFTATIKLYT